MTSSLTRANALALLNLKANWLLRISLISTSSSVKRFSALRRRIILETIQSKINNKKATAIYTSTVVDICELIKSMNELKISKTASMTVPPK